MIKKILVIAVPAAAVLAGLFFALSAYVRYSEDYVLTYVASHQLMQRTLIEEKDLESVMVPKEFLTDDVYREKKDILGKYVKLTYTVPKGSLFYRNALEKDIKDLANTLLMPDQANYDLYINEVKANTGNLASGMYVNLYLTVNAKERPVSDLLISDCRITGMFDSNGKAILNHDSDTRVQIVSLAVEKDDIPILNKALLVGDISVVASQNPYQVNVRSRLNSTSEVLPFLE